MQQWAIGCAWFVQIAHLYALAATLGRTAFNARLGSRAYANVPDSTPASEFNTAAGTPFYFRSHKSGGIATEVCYFAADKKSSMQNQVTKVTDPRSPSEILASAPEGSRVCFRNPQSQSSVWMNENTIKLGPDRYAAHGAVGSTGKNVFSSAELKEIMCVNGKSTDPGEIFVQYIEHYEDPPFLHSRDSFVQALEDAVAKLKSCGFAYPVSMDGEYVQGFDHYDPAVWKEISSEYEPDPAWLKMKTSYGV